PKVKIFVEVGETKPAPFAERYEALAKSGKGEPLGIERSPDDQVMVCTGGTTGMPKGVMYAQGDLAAPLLVRLALLTGKIPEKASAVVEMMRGTAGTLPRYLPACPQMHGTGFFGTMSTLMS